MRTGIRGVKMRDPRISKLKAGEKIFGMGIIIENKVISRYMKSRK
jgi:hypothetical protein